jgi:DNA-binding transcriptional ArsR family regulator
METRKVSKSFTAKYDILSDVIVSPTRIEIINKLSDYPTGLPYEEIVKLIPEDLRQSNVQRHLDHLIKENVIIENNDGKYSLTEWGEKTYNMLVKAASEIKAESQAKSE